MVVHGHTFIDHVQPYIPSVELSSSVVLMPPVFQNIMSFNSFEIKNKASTKCFFKIVNHHQQLAFKPTIGIIGKHKSTNILIKFQSATTVEGSVWIKIRLNQQTTLKVRILINCSTSKVEIQNE